MTTPVGSIRLDLVVDGSKVDEQAITDAVRRRLLPAIEEATAGLGDLEDAHKSAGQAAKKSADEQVAAQKRTTAQTKVTKTAADDLEQSTVNLAVAQREFDAALDLFGRKSPQAESAYKRLVAVQNTYSTNLTRAAAESRASTDSQIDDFRRLARAAEQFEAQQAARARSAGVGGGGGGGRGGGTTAVGVFGGGGRRGGGGAFGDLFTGQGGGARFLTSPVGLNSLALGASALPAATLAVTNLAGAVQQFAQGGLLLPGVIGGIVASVSTLKIGLSGVEDGFTAAWEAAKSGDPKDIKKATEAMDGLAGSAKSTIAAVVGFRPQWEHLQRDVAQQNVFEGLDTTFTNLANKALPTAEKGVGALSKAWNSTIKTFASALGTDQSISLMDRIFGNTAEGQNRLNAAIQPAVNAVQTLTAKGTEFLPRLADGMTAGLTRLDNWVTRSAENGNLDKWINQGIDAAGHLGESMLSIGKIITSVTQAAGGDGGFLKMLEDGTTKLATFLSSAEGQEKLTSFFDDARRRAAEWLPVLKDVASTVGDVFQGFQQWGDAILPAVSGITGFLSDMPGLVTGAVSAFLAFKTFSGLASLIGSVSTLGGLLDGLPGKASRAGGAVGAGGGGLFGNRFTAGAGIATAGMLAQATDPGWGGAAATIGGAALAGSQFGLPGLAIGTVIGIAAAGLQGLAGDINNTRNALGNFAQKLQDEAAKNPVLNPGHGVELKPGFVPIPGNEITANTPLPPSLPVVNGVPINPLIGGPPVVSGRNADQYNPPVQNTIPNMMPGMSPEQIEAIAGAAQNATAKVSGLGDALGKLTSPPPIKIDADTSAADAAVKGFVGRAIGMNVTIPVTASVSGLPAGPRPNPTGSWWGSADGGVLPGYSPGVDNMLWPMSGGEGVLIPEAMRALGAKWLYRVNSFFRPGISQRGYSGGGVVGFDSGGIVPDVVGGGSGFSAALAPVIGLLTQIRDVLGGGATPGASGTVLGALGEAAPTAAGTASVPGLTAAPAGGVLGAVDLQRITANLSAFARSGNLADVTGLGLDANDPIVTAIVSARNKKSGGLEDDQIGELIAQVMGGGYTGVLDGSNSSLVKSLTTFRDKLGKKGGVGGADLTSPRGIAAAFGGDIGKRFMANLLAGAGADAQFIGEMLGAPMYTPTGNSASTSQLLAEKNLFGAAGGLLGYEVPDHTRQGGAPGMQDTMATNTPTVNAVGQMGSDIAGMIDRSMTSFKATMDAKFDQMTAILTQMRDQLASIAGKLVNSAISSGGQAAGQVAGSIPLAPGSGGAPGGFVDLSGTKGFGPFLDTGYQIGHLYDEGGLWPSGTFGTNLSGAPERVLDPHQTRLFDAGLLGGWNRQPLQQHQASIPGVDVTDSVGADFFGISEIPIIGAIVNMLVSILLKTLGIHIEARNTLRDLTDQVRQFRGDFKSFNVSGQIAGDSSGLISRNQSSKDTVNKERVRILTEVIVGVIKYLIEKVIVPLVNTLIQSAISIGQQAIGMAISAGVNSVAPGAGGIAGQAGSAIAGIVGSLANTLAQVASEFLGQLAVNAVTELVPGILNLLPTALFGLFDIPGMFSKLFGGLGAMLAAVVGVFGGVFDEGGVASGVGLLPKATVRPERVLSPSQTASFERLVDILDASGIRGGGSHSEYHVPIYVQGGDTAPTAIRDEIVALAGT